MNNRHILKYIALKQTAQIHKENAINAQETQNKIPLLLNPLILRCLLLQPHSSQAFQTSNPCSLLPIWIPHPDPINTNPTVEYDQRPMRFVVWGYIILYLARFESCFGDFLVFGFCFNVFHI